jgi:hypothetical protein
VHRVLALLLIPALIATFGAASSVHTHAYVDHDHPEHRHGLAAHEHHGMPVDPDDGTPHLEGCDPGQHTVSFAFVCAGPPPFNSVDAEVSLPASSSAELQIEGAIRHTDVRGHSPPSRTPASPRAPPTALHA